MSEALTPDAPETDSAVPSVEDHAPGDGTAVAAGSAGDSEDWKKRFDGLMASSQRRENELRNQLQALEARITSQEKPTVADDAVLSEVQELRRQLQEERLEAAREKALAKYPAAAPLADLIIGSTPEEIDTIARAVADRLSKLAPAPTGETPPLELNTELDVPPSATPPIADEPPASQAPVIGGGSAAPNEPTRDDAVRQALQQGSWSDYWTAKSGAKSSQNLG